MSEIAQLPHTQALLRVLCGWSAADEALPLQVLFNLHKGVLRAPLNAMVECVEFTDGAAFPSGASGNLDMLHERYPATLHTFSAQSGQLNELYAQVNPLAQSLRMQASAYRLGIAFLAIFRQADKLWVGTWPAILLHRLTWEAQPLALLLQMLEVMLEADPTAESDLLL